MYIFSIHKILINVVVRFYPKIDINDLNALKKIEKISLNAFKAHNDVAWTIYIYIYISCSLRQSLKRLDCIYPLVCRHRNGEIFNRNRKTALPLNSCIYVGIYYV